MGGRQIKTSGARGPLKWSSKKARGFECTQVQIPIYLFRDWKLRSL